MFEIGLRRSQNKEVRRYKCFCFSKSTYNLVLPDQHEVLRLLTSKRTHQSVNNLSISIDKYLFIKYK